ncbi:peptidase M14 [Robertkochia marina]|uniref:Peptidase M14 n=1 Tax=Robertkochia marina TaxID=1227945 RepID=A0A4S3M4C0_9FLAO|nr:M14 family zinc carboxypeptidase [Robertkochia marina]THD69963.1 peptidase M14 [Robertkochia marina]TRZ46692.1 peptidase M14 [Robertkochia marina]
MKRVLSFLTILLVVITVNAQDFMTQLDKDYKDFMEPAISKRRIKHSDVSALVEKVKEMKGVEVNTVGHSIEGRPLYLISLGKGDTDVFLWSQMHGDESTATMAIFDILNFFEAGSYKKEKREMLKNLRIHFLPMLNPDGAELFTRRNRLGIDINRDALRLQSPESKTLKRVRDSLDADFGFNLHDQSRYYNANLTAKPATVSYLAPAYNYEKEINETRGDAMKIIVLMNDVLQHYVPGQVGRYNDDFEPRAFGDNIQKWGTSTILIESGGTYEDREKQEIRKLNFVSILTALSAIADESFKDIPVDRYFEIPNNDRKLFDLKLTGLTYDLLGEEYILDVGFYQFEKDNEAHSDYFIAAGIGDLGDLSTFYGYETINAEGLKYVPAKAYPATLKTVDDAKALAHHELIKKGYGYLQVNNIPKDLNNVALPMHLVTPGTTPDFEIRIGNNPSFFLADQNGVLKYYVYNGYLIDMKSLKNAMVPGNALIVR